MGSEGTVPVVYWDASAVISVLIQDAHSRTATEALRRPLTHLLSTLAYAEVMAVIARLEREAAMPVVLAESAREVVRGGPWRRLALQPDRVTVDDLSTRWPLRGGDLWHLALVSTLRRELPEVQMITFDSRLASAAASLGLSLPN